MTPSPSPAEPLANGFNELLPRNAKKVADDTFAWIKDHPTEATLIAAAGGVLLGLVGVGRIYRGVRAVRSMPLVSQFVLGAVVKGLLSKDYRGPAESIH